MRALVYTGPEEVELRDAPEPVPGPGERLVAVEAVGICGSDMHAYLGHDARRPAPLILGHEAAGRLEDATRVAVNPLVTCGACADCRAGRDNLCASRQIISMPPREGAFAERLAMPADNLIAIPDDVATEKAALTEPLACGWHAVTLAERHGGVPLAEAVCLAQGGGAIGLGAALALTARGAREVWLAEPSAARRAAVARAAEVRVYDPGASDGPQAVDVVVDGVGIPATRRSASQAVRPGGVIVHVGLGSGSDAGSGGGLDLRRLTLQEIAFVGAYTYTRQDFAETAAALFAGRLGGLDWVEVRPLSEGARAFADLRAGRVAAPKIVLQP